MEKIFYNYNIYKLNPKIFEKLIKLFKKLKINLKKKKKLF